MREPDPVLQADPRCVELSPFVIPRERKYSPVPSIHASRTPASNIRNPMLLEPRLQRQRRKTVQLQSKIELRFDHRLTLVVDPMSQKLRWKVRCRCFSANGKGECHQDCGYRERFHGFCGQAAFVLEN